MIAGCAPRAVAERRPEIFDLRCRGEASPVESIGMESESDSKPEATDEPPPPQMPTALVSALLLQLIEAVHRRSDWQNERECQ
jgi:hypothetical protein